MKYVVKNRKTGEETLCEKVEVGGHDYYLSENPGLDDYCYNPRTKEFFRVLDTMMIDGLNKNKDDYKVIATTNKSLTLPMVIDEVEELAEIDTNKCHYYKYPNSDNGYYDHVEGFKSGYKIAKETYSYTKEDMLEFATWFELYFIQHSIGCYEDSRSGKLHKSQSIFDIWQEQRIKTIIVE